MKAKIITASTAVAVVIAWLVLPAQSEFPRMRQVQEVPADAEKPEKGPKLPAYTVLSSPKGTENPESDEGKRMAREFADSLNKVNVQGYRFAGMNQNWVVMERPLLDGIRRRVVLPTNGNPSGAPVPAPPNQEPAPSR
ncbi:MAG TPA: hypothetical protein VG796_09020 [Verrucomicrobiales bacterium]|nr:hypothetical protein [Verrucomicrobiales bacterium]